MADKKDGPGNGLEDPTKKFTEEATVRNKIGDRGCTGKRQPFCSRNRIP